MAPVTVTSVVALITGSSARTSTSVGRTFPNIGRVELLRRVITAVRLGEILIKVTSKTITVGRTVVLLVSLANVLVR